MKKPSLVRFPWTLRVARNRVLGGATPIRVLPFASQRFQPAGDDT